HNHSGWPHPPKWSRPKPWTGCWPTCGHGPSVASPKPGADPTTSGDKGRGWGRVRPSPLPRGLVVGQPPTTRPLHGRLSRAPFGFTVLIDGDGTGDKNLNGLGTGFLVLGADIGPLHLGTTRGGSLHRQRSAMQARLHRRNQ